MSENDGRDSRDRLEIIQELVAARKTIYDLREALNWIVLLYPDRFAAAHDAAVAVLKATD